MSDHEPSNANDGQSRLTAGLGTANLQFVYEKLDGGDFGSIRICFYAQTKDGLVLWKSGELNLHEGDTVTLTGITVMPNAKLTGSL